MDSIPADEAERLKAVKRYDILDTPPDGAFDRITAIAARLFGVPIAIVSIVDEDRIWFKSHHGLDIREIGRDPGLCASAILTDTPWVIENAETDMRALANPLVAGEFGLRFYAGAPLRTQDGFGLGTLCVIDKEPRGFSEADTRTLSDLAAVVMDELELRLSARREIARREQAQEQQKLLIQELHHRVKNTLATVQAMLSATARSARSIDEFYRSFAARITSLAKTHSILTESVRQAAALGELLRLELDPYDDGTGRIALQGPVVQLPSEIAVPIGMAIHELTTNAAKYGALSVLGGRVEVTWETRSGDGVPMLHLEWIERDGPVVEAPTRQGFGSRLLDRVLQAQLRGEVVTNYGAEGLRFTIDIPLDLRGSAARARTDRDAA